MITITNKDLIQELTSITGKLANPESYKLVYHRPKLSEEMLSVKSIEEIMDTIREIIFPGYFGNTAVRADTIKFHIGVSVDKLYKQLVTQIHRGFCFVCDHPENEECNKCGIQTEEIAVEFLEKLPEIREKLAKDVHSMYLYDPAAKGYGEIIFAYPAIKAITNYRIANTLLKLNVPIIPRIISEMAHSETGIDIHPGAQIGENFVIDHGTGVVIGETCIIGNNVRLYQGVTLGARSFKLDDKGNPVKGVARHPIVEDDVIIYSGATILGRITIGKGSVVGGNVWVTNNLPPNSRIVQGRNREALFENGGGI
jgi:serine O-acetyltransferase